MLWTPAGQGAHVRTVRAGTSSPPWCLQRVPHGEGRRLAPVTRPLACSRPSPVSRTCCGARWTAACALPVT